jgi:ABC-type transport system involved in cytochrome c biogenesis permease subunit
VTIYAMVIQLIDFWNHVPRLWIPFGTCLLILTLAAWLLIEGLMAYLRYQRSRPSVGIPVEAASGSGS